MVLFPCKNVGAVTILLVPSFVKISQQFSKKLRGHYFQTEIFRGHNSPKNVGRVMVLNPCTSFYDALYLVYICTKFHENILDGIKVIEQT